MKRLIVALACALVASTAHADHWFSLGYIDEVSMLVNVDSFNTDEDGYCGVWVGYVYPYRNDYTFEMAFLKFSEIAFKYKKEDEFRYTNDKLTNEWHSQIAFWRQPAPSSKMAKALQKIIIMSKDPNQTTITGSYYEDNGDPVKFFTEYRNTEIKLQNIFNELKATQTDKP